MKVLIYGINFAPELTGIGKYSAEMAAWLHAAGHDVRVITAPPYYPEWSVRTGYHAGRYSSENWNGVKVIRAPLWVPRKPSGLRRIIHLATFAISSIPPLISQYRWRPDIVWVTEPPLFCAPAALAFARIVSASSWLHIQDYEVDAAFALGLLKGSTVRNMVLRTEKWLMRRFDRVSTISHRMQERAMRKGVAERRLLLLPNWADVSAIQPLQTESGYRAQLKIPQYAVVALYSGNMGKKQGLEVLAEAAVMLANNPAIVFVFCGDGPGKSELLLRCAHLPCVRFLGLQPLERLGELLGVADIHLLPQRANAADLVMPSKLTGMLSSGRPVIATARLDTELGTVVAQCGLLVPPEQPAALAERIEWLAGEPELRRTLGQRARRYAEENLAKEAVLTRLQGDMQACITARRE